MSAPPPVAVKRGLAGLGLFATDTIPRGQFILTYDGERISPEEGDRRGGKYLFTVSPDCIIDGKARSNLARYINHACTPNAYAEADEDALMIRIYAKRKIRAGEEITYHYGRDYFNDMIAENCQCVSCLAN